MGKLFDTNGINESFFHKFTQTVMDKTTVIYDSDFADIFIESGTKKHSTSFKNAASETIIKRSGAEKKAYDMYKSMKDMCPDDDDDIEYVYDLDATLFCRQGNLLCDFSDNYSESADISDRIPTYQKLTFEQFRTYFTWRANLKNGKICKTQLPYVLLYIFEIINGIGFKSIRYGFNAFLKLWREYAALDNQINTYLKEWFVSFYIMNAFSKPFYDFVRDDEFLYGIYGEPPQTDYFSIYSGISSYKYKESPFYSDETEKELHACFNYVVEAINKREGNQYFFDEIMYIRKPNRLWVPYQNAIYSAANAVSRNLIPSCLPIRFSIDKIYQYNRISWEKSSKPVLNTAAKKIMNYIIRTIESYLRSKSNFKSMKVFPNITAALSTEKAISEYGLDMVTQYINEYYNNTHKINVTVDMDRVSDIRVSALETQERLLSGLNDDDSEDIINSVKPPETEKTDVYIQADKQPESIESREDINKNININKNKNENNTADLLGSLLTETEKEALIILLNGGGINEYTQYAKKKGIMPEMLADSINEKAAEALNDNILELSDTIEIYDDYIEALKEILKGAVGHEAE